MRKTLAYIAAGLAALTIALALLHRSRFPNLPASLTIRFLTMVVFFGVLILVDRTVFSSNEGSDAESIRDWLYAIPKMTVLIPFMFFLRLGEIGPLGWGMMVFFDLYCALWAFGLYFRPKQEFHTQVPLREQNQWLDKVGAFWLVGCAFGPFFGWVVTQSIPLTQATWRWLFGARIFLAALVPILLALPLLRYIRGKAASIALPLLIVLTMISVSTATYVTQDLISGPVERVNSLGDKQWYLPHTNRDLGKIS